MNLFPFFVVLLVGLADGAKEKRLTNSKLVCYYGKAEDAVSWKCSHVVLPQDSDIEAAREKLNGVKILLTVDRINEVIFLSVKVSVFFIRGQLRYVSRYFYVENSLLQR